MRRIHVIAAVIRDAQGRILIARRPDHVHQGGLWEFPGGKLEADEPRFDGLVRELREELGVTVTVARPLLDIRHDYPDKSVRLDVWLVTGFEGEAHGAEGQPVRWVAAAELDSYAFPAANAPIVRAAQLPETYLITPDVQGEAELFAGLERAREASIRMVQLRQTGLSAVAYRALAERVLERFGDDFQWMLKGDEPPAWPGVGWHLTSVQLRGMWERWDRMRRPTDAVGARAHLLQEAVVYAPPVGGAVYTVPGGSPEHATLLGGAVHTPPVGGAPSRRRWPPGQPEHPAFLAASCHNAEELAMASDLGVDFVTLSPVLLTATHPDATPLGWEHAQELIDTVNLPVYLLGGMSPEKLPEAFEAGAQGIAAIRALWQAKLA